MAYNLPAAWDPGFVLPKNAQDEGLERRAFVTKWMPRGTYDDSTDGTAGYMVPQYIKDEGVGQGAFTTFWQPRGTYNGGRIPHWLNNRPTVTRVTPIPGGGRQVTVQPMGDAPMAEPFEIYGQKAAAVMITGVSRLPQGQRQKALKGLLDRLDKSLWTRTQDIFNRYVKEQKIAPADAFPMALARALSTGIAAEIITTGARRTAPQAASLLGLGCYGCEAVLGAMGDDAVPAGCTPAPAGFTWIYTANVNGVSIPGHWARLQEGQTPQPFCPGGAPAGAITVADVAAATGVAPIVVEHAPAYDWFVGPFGFNTKTFVPRIWRRGTVHAAGAANFTEAPDIMYLTPDQPLPGVSFGYARPMIPEVLAWLKARLTEAKDAAGMTDTPTTYGDPSEDRKPSSYAWSWAGDSSPGQLADAQRWFDAMGIAPSTPLRLHTLWELRTTISPFARTKHIKTGQDMVLYVQLIQMDIAKPWDAKSNPLVLKVWLSTVPDPSIFGALWNPMVLINPLTALSATASVIAGIAPIVGDLACDVLKNPAAGPAAGAAAAAYGLPPQVGTTGVAIAAGQCGQPAPPRVVPVVTHPIWPWVLLGGGAIAAVAILRKKPKKKAP